jgi:L-asparaginase
MLEGLGKPVILTGSQIPLCELRSDGKDNLITSMMIAADGVACEVCLYFGNSLMRGNRAVKQSADGIMAFDSPNYPDLAKAGVFIEYRHRTLLKHSEEELSSGLNAVMLRKCRLGVIKVFPGIQFDLFAPIVHENLDGLILETFGTGNIPEYDKALTALISEAGKRGTIVVVCTQCSQGTVRLGTYKAGSALVEVGAVSGCDMTTEAAVTKLSYLLSKGFARDEIRKIMEQNIRGELSPL